MATAGTQLMEKINSGEIQTVKSGVTKKIRQDVSSVFEEILGVGARIRPILLDGSRIGWIRGLSVNERKLLASWFNDQNELITQALVYSTSLSKEDIVNLNSYEFRSLLRLANIMSTADVSLYPYLVPYTSTSSSDDLWRACGCIVPQFLNKDITMPDSKTIRILCNSDHSRFWASLCSKRDQASSELSGNYDAAMVAGAMVGKSVQKYITNLNKRALLLEINSDNPWKNISTIDQADSLDLNDGWGHAHEDSSEAGLLREGEGMVGFDKHEQFMETFYDQYMNRQQKKTEITKRTEQGLIDEVSSIMTEKEVQARERDVDKESSRIRQMAVDEASSASDRMEQKDNMTFIVD